jgi:hypothetical protein
MTIIFVGDDDGYADAHEYDAAAADDDDDVGDDVVCNG